MEEQSKCNSEEYLRDYGLIYCELEKGHKDRHQFTRVWSWFE